MFVVYKLENYVAIVFVCSYAVTTAIITHVIIAVTERNCKIGKSKLWLRFT